MNFQSVFGHYLVKISKVSPATMRVALAIVEKSCFSGVNAKRWATLQSGWTGENQVRTTL